VQNVSFVTPGKDNFTHEEKTAKTAMVLQRWVKPVIRNAWSVMMKKEI